MKRSPRPRKLINLPDSINRQLNMYALAASAAGVGVLALAQPSEARIIYQPVFVSILPNTRYEVDFASGFVEPIFTLANVHRDTKYPWGGLFASGNAGTLAGTETSDGRNSCFALSRGALIGPALRFGGARLMAYKGYYGAGYWINVTNRYLGVRIQIDGQVHYGWARLSVRVSKDNAIFARLKGFAYETIPNKPIIAGKEHDADNSVQPDTASGSLGRLALGRK